MIKAIIIGSLLNRVRGCDVRAWCFNQDDINAIVFALLFGSEWWHYLLLYCAMRVGSAMGWTEAILATDNKFELTGNEDKTWLSKYIKITNQWTCFLWCSVRSFIWVTPLLFASCFMGDTRLYTLLAVPLFYVAYRIGHYAKRYSDNFIIKKLFREPRDIFGVGEVIFGAILWGLFTI